MKFKFPTTLRWINEQLEPGEAPDANSGANWTLIPAETGQSFVVTQYAG
jgi:hypothetical protein